MSDIFMRNVFKQKECLEYVLQIIMEKQDLQVIDQIIQKDYKNLQERSAIQDDTEFGRQFTWKAISTRFGLHKKRKYSLDEKEEK